MSTRSSLVARSAPARPAEVLTLDDVLALQATTNAVEAGPDVLDYAVRLVLTTRQPKRYGLSRLDGYLAYGASPRASIGLVRAARAIALLRGRQWAEPQDVYDVAYDVLNHRLVLSFDAIASGVTIDDVLVDLLSTVTAPRPAAAA